jgi:regulator of protease activity HflC (stomatin/prohibitin superfamily)
MFGFHYYKYSPTEHVLVHREGRIVREGRGLAFLAYTPSTSVVVVPTASTDVPFMFDQTTADFQTVSIQGRATYRIVDARRTAELLDFSRRPDGRSPASEDPERLPQRVAEAVQGLSRAELGSLFLQDAVTGGDAVATRILGRLREDAEMTELGLQILGLAVLAVKPTKETARALEAQTREEILRKADEAGFARRNASIGQERIIRDSELDAQRAAMNKEKSIEAERLKHETSAEEKRTALVALEAANVKAKADGKAYELAAVLHALEGVDKDNVRALALAGMRPDAIIATAFADLAGSAERIGTLNISPDLLGQLLTAGGSERTTRR